MKVTDPGIRIAARVQIPVPRASPKQPESAANYLVATYEAYSGLDCFNFSLNVRLAIVQCNAEDATYFA